VGGDCIVMVYTNKIKDITSKIILEGLFFVLSSIMFNSSLSSVNKMIPVQSLANSLSVVVFPSITILSFKFLTNESLGFPELEFLNKATKLLGIFSKLNPSILRA